jgi:hypothetical protein
MNPDKLAAESDSFLFFLCHQAVPGLCISCLLLVWVVTDCIYFSNLVLSAPLGSVRMFRCFLDS